MGTPSPETDPLWRPLELGDLDAVPLRVMSLRSVEHSPASGRPQ